MNKDNIYLYLKITNSFKNIYKMLPHKISEVANESFHVINTQKDELLNIVNDGIDTFKHKVSQIITRNYTVIGIDSNPKWTFHMSGKQFKHGEHGKVAEDVEETGMKKGFIKKVIQKATPKGFFKDAIIHEVVFRCAIPGKELKALISFKNDRIMLYIKDVEHIGPPMNDEYSKYLYGVQIKGVDNDKPTKDELSYSIGDSEITYKDDKIKVLILQAHSLGKYLDDNKDSLEISFRIISLVETDNDTKTIEDTKTSKDEDGTSKDEDGTSKKGFASKIKDFVTLDTSST